jgi:subtilase family serine protease
MIKLLSVLAVATALTACGGGSGGLDVAGANPATTEATMSPMAAITSASAAMQASVTTAGGLSSFGQSPAAVRTRYGFDALTTPAQQGSGQTIVIISAYDNPTAGADLAAFSAAKGIAGCPTVATTFVTPTNSYPQAVVPKPVIGDGCTFQKFNANPNGLGANPTAIQYDTSGMWIAESNMDIQWAHAMAPMAKIVLVQGSNNFISSLSGAVAVANQFADVISMSWGGYESALNQTTACTTNEMVFIPGCTLFTKTQYSLFGAPNTTYGTAGGYDTKMFSNPNVTYVAASGDAGSKPLWPSVSTKVLAVGGTNSSGATDTGWTGSGGGVSTYYTRPSWQTVSGNAQRTTPDVAMPADSATPMSVYVSPQKGMPDTACVTAKGAAACGWYAGYGTSVSAPMWAGLAAVTKAVRTQNGKPVVDFIASLYNVAAVQGNYVTAFGDVTTGTNGLYSSKAGYDLVTGLGVPKANALVGMLAAQ